MRLVAAIDRHPFSSLVSLPGGSTQTQRSKGDDQDHQGSKRTYPEQERKRRIEGGHQIDYGM
jgi:hypothetical protein